MALALKIRVISQDFPKVNYEFEWNNLFLRLSLTTEGATEKVSQFIMPHKSS